MSKKKWMVNRVTYSEIEIEAETEEEAIDVMSEIDGDDDDWEYYDEELFLMKKEATDGER